MCRRALSLCMKSKRTPRFGTDNYIMLQSNIGLCTHSVLFYLCVLLCDAGVLCPLYALRPWTYGCSSGVMSVIFLRLWWIRYEVERDARRLRGVVALHMSSWNIPAEVAGLGDGFGRLGASARSGIAFPTS